MRRLTRYTLNALTLLSLVLCVATVWLWVRSYRYRPGHLDAKRVGSFFAISDDGELSVFRSIPAGGVSEVDFRYWKWAAIFSVLPLFRPVLWGLRRSSGAADTAARICPACGYDLRATPDRCPECGAVPPKA